MSGKRIEAGIYLTSSQRYQVRVQDRKGSTKTVSTVVDDLHEARRIVAESRQIRDAGGSVKAAWESRVLAATRSRVRTFEEQAEKWLDERAELVRVSDHRRSASHAGVGGLRPGVHEVDSVKVRRHLIPHLGGLLTTDIEAADVSRVMQRMAEAGLSADYQEAVLLKLRQIIGTLGAKQRPDGYPWKSVLPVPPTKPRTEAPDPRVWGGRQGDAPPVVIFTRVAAIASQIRACLRIVCWCQAILGLRRGETMGLRNSDFSIRNGAVWVTVERQMSLKTALILFWVKSDASLRDLPIPRVLLEYLEMYWDRYHMGFRPGLVDHPRWSTRLVVTSTGRDRDGSFLEASPHPYAINLKAALKRLKLTRRHLGYKIKPHTLRKTCSTYLLNAQPILRAILEQTERQELDPDADDATRAAYFEAALQRRALLDSCAFSPADVSRWMGHEVGQDRSAKDDGTSASPVTLDVYGLSVGNRDAEYLAMADFLDRVVRHEIGSLLDEPDDHDSRMVIEPGDPDWVLAREAARITGKREDTLTAGIRNGTYQGACVWFADGDREPPGPRLVIARTDVERILKRNASISRSEAARRLGMSNNYVDGAISRGVLDVVEHHETCVYIDPASVERLRRRIAEVVAALFDTKAVTIAVAHRRFQQADDQTPTGIALRAVDEGRSIREAAAIAGINPHTLGSLVRRRRAESIGTADQQRRQDIRELFARPKRVSLATFSRWVDDAIDYGLLERVNHTHVRRCGDRPTTGVG